MNRVPCVVLAAFATTAVSLGADSTLGSWEYDTSASLQLRGGYNLLSEWGGASPIRTLTVTRDAVDGGVRVVVRGQREDGSWIGAVATVKYGGEMADVKGTGLPWNLTAVKQIDANKLAEERWSFGGSHLLSVGSAVIPVKAYHSKVQIVVSKDGKRMTWTSKGVGADGFGFGRSVSVFDRLADSSASGVMATSNSTPNIPESAANDQGSEPLVWIEPRTELMWARQDNGADISWHHARDYCASLNTTRYAGYIGWRLPEFDEFASIYDPASNEKYKIRKPLRVSDGFVWSGRLDATASHAAVFSFEHGKGLFWVSGLDADGSCCRTLCVRRSGK